MKGTVYLVGAGPGASDLLTLRAARLLAKADVVFHDALVPREIVDLAVHAKKIAVGKRHGRHSTAQHFINKRLADAARHFRVVVRLKGGDPMLFGRAQEEISYLQESKVRVEVVPGVTAALAASARLGVSLTQRGLARSVVFATPRAGDGEVRSAWAKAVAAADTAALYMAVHDAQAVRDALLGAGMKPETPVAVVESASLPGEATRTGVLKDLPLFAGSNGGPVLLLLGAVYAEAGAAGALRARSAIQAA